MRTELHSRGQTVVIGPDVPFVLIGERINPTGRAKLAAQMAAGDFSGVRRDAQLQAAAGARALDVNAGCAVADETSLLPSAVQAIQQVCDLPLCLDSANIHALQAALAVYQGKALVNSVTGEDFRLNAILPLVRKHESAVIGMLCDEYGIPADPARRLDIGRKIVERARDYGIAAEDVILDPVCLAIATDPQASPATLQTLRLLRDELGVNTCCGASNIGFGLPDRSALSAAFLPMAIACGLTSAIADVTSPQIRDAVLASDLLLARDESAARWLARYREKQQSGALSRAV